MPKLTSSNLSQQLQEGAHYTLSLPCSVDNYLARLKNTVSGHRKKKQKWHQTVEITKTKFFLGPKTPKPLLFLLKMLKKSDRVNEESSNEVITEKNDSVKSVEKAINSRQSLPN